jgi:hypothetical protein
LQPYIVANYIIKTTFGTNPDQTQDTEILASYNGRLTDVEGKIAPVTNGYYLRRVFSEIDTTNRTFGTGWTLVWTTTNRQNFFEGSRIKLTIELPLRNDATGWGGAYIEPQVSFDNSTYYSLGSSGYDGNVMQSGATAIATYTRSLWVDPAAAGITAPHTFRVRFRCRSYEGTTLWNQSHDINSVSGTAALLTGGTNADQHYARVVVEEWATGQG